MRRELYPTSKQNAQKKVDTGKLEKHLQHVKKSEDQGYRDAAFFVTLFVVCAFGLYLLYNNNISASKNQNGVVKSIEPNSNFNKPVQTSGKSVE